MNNIIATYPAYDVVQPDTDDRGAARITAGEPLMIYRGDNYTGDSHEAYAGSIVSYALASGRDPIELVQRALKNGEEMHWISLASVTITARRRAKRVVKALHAGQLVNFEGLTFAIVNAANDNYRLEQVEL